VANTSSRPILGSTTDSRQTASAVAARQVATTGSSSRTATRDWPTTIFALTCRSASANGSAHRTFPPGLIIPSPWRRAGPAPRKHHSSNTRLAGPFAFLAYALMSVGGKVVTEPSPRRRHARMIRRQATGEQSAQAVRSGAAIGMVALPAGLILAATPALFGHRHRK